MAFSNLYQTINVHVEEIEGEINTEMEQKLGETKKSIKIRKSRDPKDEDLDIDEIIHEENPYGDFYVNEEPLHDVALSNLGITIEEKSENEDDGFKKEYAVGSFVLSFYLFFLHLIVFNIKFSKFRKCHVLHCTFVL